jgi:hypothetical protein
VNIYLSTTKEFIWLPVYNDGVLVTEGVQYSVVLQPGNEGAHTAADIMNGKTGRVIDNLEPGLYKVWASVTGGPVELPHIALGSFRVIAD